ncbi:uncharacterized protein LOC129230466 [Uloborus diversus]|uniref:uncharacterized protein LOC129230466 n=1 Tax=Uloborus diversus TaxID=327109 RepID=UPI002409BC0D|nr:uncharacterized protein LOC129230466 [Uloborus diversus]
MASSSSFSSTSPSASIATASTDLQETDAFSDDSGVDVKLQLKKPHPRFSKFIQESDSAAESNKRNKRKSSEPKKRKDVLQMKRFRWDTDEEDNDADHREEEDVVDDVFDVIERERPSSGDSGYQMEPSSTMVINHDPEKKKRQKQWRKPKVEKYDPTIKQEEIIPTFRQSVIRKHEASATCTSSGASSILSYSSTKDLSSVSLLQSTSSSSLATTLAGQSIPSIVKTISPQEYDPSADSQDDSNLPSCSRTSRTVGRPRNYKSMSRQRRIEANARERTRVHTISAAFENLRRAVPAYAHNQKLSKLAILRIASAYIVALACLNKQDYSQEQSRPALAECVEQCTRTIQAEGRSRRRTSKD